MLRFRLGCVALGLAVWGAPAAVAQDRVSLRPRWTPGRTIYLEWHWNSRNLWTDAQDPEQVAPSREQQIQGFLCTVLEARPDGGARLRCTFDRFALRYDSVSERFAFDSDRATWAGEDNPLKDLLMPILGRSFELDIDGQVRIAAVRGMDGFADFLDGLSAREDIQRLMRNLLNEKAVRFIWGQFLGLYAGREVRPGDTWTGDYVSNRGVVTFEYKFDRFASLANQRVALISYTALRQATEPESDQPLEPGQVRFRSSESRIKGAGTFDLDRGEIIGGNETNDETGSAERKNPETGALERRDLRARHDQMLTILTGSERQKQKRHPASAPATQPGAP
jgi:hypothetical protein